MIIFTGVWGDEYLRYMNLGLVSSLSWAQNRAAIARAHWIIASREPERERICGMIEGLVGSVEFIADDLFGGVKYAMRKSMHCGAPLLMAPPDTVFSDGSIPNLLAVGSRPGICVASPHVRVLPSYLEFGFGISEPTEMVKHAWSHLHDSWVHSEAGRDPSVCHFGGVRWQRLESNLIAVQHRLPTVFLANFIQHDLDFFESETNFGVWDNVWPPVCLVDQQRYRLMGSSDAGFMVEITHKDRNVPQFEKMNPNEPDSFLSNSLHNKVNRLFLSFFRQG